MRSSRRDTVVLMQGRNVQSSPYHQFQSVTIITRGTHTYVDASASGACREIMNSESHIALATRAPLKSRRRDRRTPRRRRRSTLSDRWWIGGVARGACHWGAEGATGRACASASGARRLLSQGRSAPQHGAKKTLTICGQQKITLRAAKRTTRHVVLIELTVTLGIELSKEWRKRDAGAARVSKRKAVCNKRQNCNSSFGMN